MDYVADPEAYETARLAALRRYAILDTEPESGFDDIVLLATHLCDTPVALVSLVADTRQWFKARIGIDACETPLSQSVCVHALRQSGVMVIPDLSADERTRRNTLVTGEPRIRFYAGAPLETPEGLPLGTLCVIDTEPRPAGLSPAQVKGLEALARQVMAQLELRRAVAQRDRALAQREEAEAAFKRHQDMLSRELSHRLKNILAMVQAIVSQTLRNATSLEAAGETLSHRLLALGNAHEILFEDGATESAGIEAVIRRAVELHDDGLGRRFRLEGPAVQVNAKAALGFAMMLHELATNAVKYGALSTPHGAVAIEWVRSPDRDEPYLTLFWRESGGPPVAPPTRKGFGTRLIERALSGAVGGVVTLAFPAGGVECRVDAPLSGFEGPAPAGAASRPDGDAFTAVYDAPGTTRQGDPA